MRAITERQRPSRLRRLLWFAALYLAGLATVVLGAYGLRALMGTLLGN